MPLRPLHDQIVVRQFDEEEVTEAGIVLAGNAKEKPSQGVVIAVGEGVHLDNGDFRKPSVPVGSTIVFGKNAGQKVEVDGEELLVMREVEIFGVIE